MRILAIRGANLASLAGPFAICFEQAPLKDAGLFAITGRTGAGKSTVLDALCLALYDKIPRLAHTTEGVPVGRAGDDESLLVRSNDVRSILRKGATHGFAEVEFVGRDKQRYKARWEVRKARNKANGKLQPQQISFSNQDTGQILGQNKTDIKQAIEECIGLTFDQFRRSVLLAQGDFAAFLKAKHDERSSLLERITGTDIYSRLSMAAFARAKEEKQRLTQLQAQLQDQVPLSDEHRKTLEQEVQQLQAVVEQNSAQLKTLEAISAWYRRAAELVNNRDQATQDAVQAQADWEAIAAARQYLLQVEACQPLRAMQEHWQQLQQALAETSRQLTEARRQQQEAQTRQNQLAGQLSQAQQAHIAAEQQVQHAQPLLKQARALDTRLQVAQTDLTTAETQLAALTEQSTEVSRQHQVLLQQQTDLQEALVQQRCQLAQQTRWQPVAAHWQQWLADLQRYCQLRHEWDSVQDKVDRIVKRIAEQERDVQQAREQRDSNRIKQQQLNAQLQPLLEQSAELSWDDLSTLRSRLDGLQPQLQQALDNAQEARKTQLRLTQNRDEALTNDEALSTATTQIAQNEQAQLVTQTALTEAKRALQLVLATQQQSAEQLRALLIDDQPCPVCGSAEHPWHSPAAVISRQTDTQQQRVDDLEREANALLVQLTEAKQQYKTAEKRQQQLADAITEDETLLQRLRLNWTDLVLADKPALFDAEESVNILQTRLAAVESERKKLAEQEKNALDLQKQVRRLQGLIDDLDKALSVFDQQIAVLNNMLTALRTEQKNGSENSEQIGKQLQAIQDGLTASFQGLDSWRLHLDENPQQFVEQCAAGVEHWLQQETRLKNLEQEWADSIGKVQLLMQRLTQAEQLQQEQAGKTEILRQHWQQLQNERHDFFDGEPADQVEQTLTKNYHQAKQRHDRIAADHAQASQAIIKMEQIVAHAEADQLNLSNQVQSAEQKLDDALAKRSLSKAQLAELLNHDEAWIHQQKQHFDDMQQTRIRCEEKLKLCTEHCLQHQTEQPDVEQVAAEQAQQTLKQQQQAVTEQLQGKRFTLARDDERKQASHDLQQSLQAQEKTWHLWACLDELIGSANGQKFRKFAQSLTLEALLAHANQHLQAFARRYQLQRAPGSDLELQVIDTDMGDEVRSVHSLSGGESFLVSLALALGLSSLAATTTPVESLFIDEGFGSLDQETLDVAMASLDTLQAMGRKVGVISHVPIMVEDIAVQVVVEKQGGGGSRLFVKG